MFAYLRRLNHSLVGRMFLLVVLPTFLIMLLVIVLAAQSGFRNLREASVNNLQSMVAVSALQIEQQNSKAVISAQRMAEAQTSGMFGDRASSMKYARTVLENYPEITAAYFGYEPNADGIDAESLQTIPTEAMTAEGRFIPYWFLTPNAQREIKLEPLVDMEKSLYYQGCKRAFEQNQSASPMITEPYVYQGKMIVEQTYPIVIDGAFRGVAGVDRALTDLESTLRKIAKQDHLDFFLISSTDKIIAATTDPEVTSQYDTDGLLKTKNINQTEYAELFANILASPRKSRTINAPDPIDQEAYYFASATIPTGDWTLIARESEAEILGPIKTQLAQRVGIVLLGLGVIIGLVLTVTLRLAKRVSQAAAVAERVASGDLLQRVDAVTDTDESGTLLRAIGVMTDNLNQLVGNVKRASIQLNSTATELAATSREQQSTASSFGASTTEIAAAVKQISATANELVGTMSDVNASAVDTAKLASTGHAALTDMATQMQGLDQATSYFGDKLAVINEKAANITGIVTTITKVADQTNLLSVNAAIEAEKAGEYGVGFLVVAREIRRLADQTAAATLDIEQMVQQMQSAVSAGVMEMDRFTDQVRRSVKDANQVSQQLSEIIDRVNSNTERFERVNESMLSQSEGADQINAAMNHLKAHATSTADAATEYANAAAELQQAIDSLKSSVASFQLRAD